MVSSQEQKGRTIGRAGFFRCPVRCAASLREEVATGAHLQRSAAATSAAQQQGRVPSESSRVLSVRMKWPSLLDWGFNGTGVLTALWF